MIGMIFLINVLMLGLLDIMIMTILLVHITIMYQEVDLYL